MQGLWCEIKLDLMWTLQDKNHNFTYKNIFLEDRNLNLGSVAL